LSQSAFDKFLAVLDQDRDRAGERYLQLRHSLIRILEWKGSWAPQEDADEIINRVCRKIEEGEQINDIFKYCHGVLKFVLLESLKTRELSLAQQVEEKKNLPQKFVADPAEEDARMVCLKRCLNDLPAEKRNLIARYYEGEKRVKIENRKRLAAELKISAHTLEVRASRIAGKLKDCVSDCLKKD